MVSTFLLCGGTARAQQFELLHSFTIGGNARWPEGSLTLSGSTLYGMTSYNGSDNGDGTIFKINTDGTGFSLLRDFGVVSLDPRIPLNSLTLGGSTLYGVSSGGGAGTDGTVFKIDTDGTGFSKLHEFYGGASDGQSPQGPLLLSGSTLYGTTQYGGDNDIGTVFKVNTDGTGFTLLHEFRGWGNGDGSRPYGALVLSGSTLYGMSQGGAGRVFKLNTDGSGYTNLHSFAVGEGAVPNGTLTLNGSTLYGYTTQGGDSDYGVLFSIQTDGSGYTNLHEFAGGVADGMWPKNDAPLLADGKLYGMTRSGGSANYGTVWSYNLVPEPSTSLLLAVGLAGLMARRRRSGKR